MIDSSDGVFEKLAQIIRAVLTRPSLDVTPALTADDVPGWNSFRMVEIIVAVEETFGVTIETWDMDEIACVGDFVLRISDKLHSSRT